MSKTERSDPPAPAVGLPVEQRVGRPEPERADIAARIADLLTRDLETDAELIAAGEGLRELRPDVLAFVVSRLILDAARSREVLTRCAAGIDHLSALARLWEPDYCSGSDRHGWLLAQDARDDARELLARSKTPNVALSGPRER